MHDDSFLFQADLIRFESCVFARYPQHIRSSKPIYVAFHKYSPSSLLNARVTAPEHPLHVIYFRPRPSALRRTSQPTTYPMYLDVEFIIRNTRLDTPPSATNQTADQTVPTYRHSGTIQPVLSTITTTVPFSAKYGRTDEQRLWLGERGRDKAMGQQSALL